MLYLKRCKGLAIGIGLLSGLAPAVAQETPPPPAAAGAQPIAVVPTPPRAEGTVGPSQLRDFSLGGPPPAERAQPEAIEVARPPATPAPERATGRESAAPASDARSAARPTAPQAPRADAPAETPTANVGAAPAAPTDFSPAIHEDELEVAAPYRPFAESGGGGFVWWPWALALLFAGGAAGYLLARRRHARMAGAGGPAIEPFVAPEPVPASPRLPRPERLQPAAPEVADDGGIVASGLKARIFPALTGRRMRVMADGSASLEVDLEVRNDGSAMARDLVLSMKLFNAGPAQDAEMMAFFKDPNRRSAALPDLQPADRVTINVDVSFAAGDVRAIDLDGRRLLIPLLGLILRYRGGPDAETRLAGAWLVGSGGEDAEKLAPFRLDLGARQWDEIALREHFLGELKD